MKQPVEETRRISPKVILFIVANDRYFCTHRLPLAKRAAQEGYKVLVASPILGNHKSILEAGLTLLPLTFHRQSINPFKTLITLKQLTRIIKDYKPDIIHNIALKPVLLGTFLGILFKTPKIINAISGLGYIFAKNSWLKTPLLSILKLLFKYPSVEIIVQNPEDEREIKKLTKNVHLLLGAGVDTNLFAQHSLAPSVPFTVLHASRLLWSKGIKEFVEAAEKLQHLPIHFQLLGEPDPENPDSIPSSIVQGWHDKGTIQWLGHQEMMAPFLQKSHIIILASYYREGIPKILLEAASCGKPIITCDMPGCRIAVIDKENGYLIPPRSSDALANAIKDLFLNPDKAKEMGEKSRLRALAFFDEAIINDKTLKLYESK